MNLQAELLLYNFKEKIQILKNSQHNVDLTLEALTADSFLTQPLLHLLTILYEVHALFHYGRHDVRTSDDTSKPPTSKSASTQLS